LAISRLKVPVRNLRWRCTPSTYGIRSSGKTLPADPPVGQERVQSALEIGLGLWAPGYNLFVTGPAGSGRLSVVCYLLRRLPPPDLELHDYAYAYNPARPEEPTLLSFPAGKAAAFHAEMEEFGRFLKLQFPQFIEDLDFQRDRRQLQDRYAHQEERLRGDLIQEAVKRRFLMAGSESGSSWFASPMPLLEDRPVTLEELQAMASRGEISDYRLKRYKRAGKELDEKIQAFLTLSRGHQKELRAELRQLVKRRIRLTIQPHIDDIRKRSEPGGGVDRYLTRIGEYIEHGWTDLLTRIDHGLLAVSEECEPEEASEEPPYHHYQVELLHQRDPDGPPPIIQESQPTTCNLFGTVEIGRDGDPTDMIRIQAGALLRADGGYLILSAEEVMAEEHLWLALKRVLQSQSIALRGPRGIRPQSISLRVKVILIGSVETYQQLSDYDPDFYKVFKVLAEFDHEMPRTPARIQDYLSVVSRTIRDEQLATFNAQAMAAMVECGARMSGRADRLTARFSQVANLAREASFWATKARSTQVHRKHVELALQRMTERHGQHGEKVREQIAEGFILIDLKGSQIGQVNALIIYEVGEHSYGVPCRITATAGPGEGSILNIERMADLSGPSHDKGILILSGFLRQRYASDKPLCLSASICFEQSYAEVDGDSASLGEVIALISSLAGIPIRQDLAVTGSINQQGEIQPVGQISEKIEGFFDVCCHAGLTGTQGVILPARNIPELMLRDDVVTAVRKGFFHVYGAKHIDEVLQLMTGISPGTRNGNRLFKRGSINSRVDTLLGEFAEIVRSHKNGNGTGK